MNTLKLKNQKKGGAQIRSTMVVVDVNRAHILMTLT